MRKPRDASQYGQVLEDALQEAGYETSRGVGLIKRGKIFTRYVIAVWKPLSKRSTRFVAKLSVMQSGRIDIMPETDLVAGASREEITAALKNAGLGPWLKLEEPDVLVVRALASGSFPRRVTGAAVPRRRRRR
jgi:hypothetical protein